jgi:hypothetical protein
MAMVPQEGNSNTPCFLLPPFQGKIKPPAMRVVVDFIIEFPIRTGSFQVACIFVPEQSLELVIAGLVP